MGKGKGGKLHWGGTVGERNRKKTAQNWTARKSKGSNNAAKEKKRRPESDGKKNLLGRVRKVLWAARGGFEITKRL